MQNEFLSPSIFSPESELALDWAIRIAKEDPDAMIYLCHVLPSFNMPLGSRAMLIDYTSYFKEEEMTAEKELKEYQSRIPETIFSAATVRHGGIAVEIGRLCKKQCIDLVIMTTRGRKGISRFLHGSTTEETVRVAPCPVIVLHLNRIVRKAVKVAEECI